MKALPLQTAERRLKWTLASSVHRRPDMLDKKELQSRVEARKHELLAKYNDLKADTRSESVETRTKMKAKLDELEVHLKGGWEKVTDAVRLKLDHWLEK